MTKALFLSALLACASPCLAEEIPEVADNGLPTPEAALAALRARNDVAITEHEQWIVATDQADGALWTFTRPGNPAHPAVVHRDVVEVDGNVVLWMKVNCGATKVACALLVRDFRALNEEMAAAIRARHGTTGSGPEPAPATGSAPEEERRL